MTSEQQQRLAVAMGMRLADGSPVIVGGAKRPSVTKILARMREHGMTARRLTRDQRSDLLDDVGAEQRHLIEWGDLPSEARAILREPCGIPCATGNTIEDELATYL